MTKRPYDDEVTMVVSLSREPPRMTVFEELVSPLAKERGAWYEIEAVPAELIRPWASTEIMGIKVVEPYVPDTTEVLAKDRETFPAVPPPVSPVPGATWVTAYVGTLAESTRVDVCPTKRLISEAEALTTEPFKKMVLKFAEPVTASL